MNFITFYCFITPLINRYFIFLNKKTNDIFYFNHKLLYLVFLYLRSKLYAFPFEIFKVSK